MTGSDDLSDAMALFPTSRDADRILFGDPEAEGFSPDAARVASLLATMRAAPTGAELTGEEQTVASIAAAVRQTPSLSAHRRTRMVPKLRSAKAAAIAAAAVLAVGTAAAAASSGALPDPAQAAASRALSNVGVSVPNPHANDHASDHTPTPGANTGSQASDHAVGPDATGHARHGLCTAWAAGPTTANPHSHKHDSVAFTNLQRAATDAGQTVEELCSEVTPPNGDDDGGASTPTTAATTQGSVPAPVTPPATPPVSTPNHGDASSGNGASNSQRDFGTGHAPPHAGEAPGNGDAHGQGRGPG